MRYIDLSKLVFIISPPHFFEYKLGQLLCTSKLVNIPKMLDLPLPLYRKFSNFQNHFDLKEYIFQYKNEINPLTFKYELKLEKDKWLWDNDFKISCEDMLYNRSVVIGKLLRTGIHYDFENRYTILFFNELFFDKIEFMNLYDNFNTSKFIRIVWDSDSFMEAFSNFSMFFRDRPIDLNLELVTGVDFYMNTLEGVVSRDMVEYKRNAKKCFLHMRDNFSKNYMSLRHINGLDVHMKDIMNFDNKFVSKLNEFLNIDDVFKGRKRCKFYLW